MVSVMPNTTPDIGSPLGITDNMEFREKKKNSPKREVYNDWILSEETNKQTNKKLN